MTWIRWERRAANEVYPRQAFVRLHIAHKSTIDANPDYTFGPGDVRVHLPATTGVAVQDVPPTPEGWAYRVVESAERGYVPQYWIEVPEPTTGHGDTSADPIDDTDLPRVSGDSADPDVDPPPTWTLALDDEVIARQQGDASLLSSLSSEVTARMASDSSLLSSINAEASARTAADSAETNDRQQGDLSLLSSINSEITARQATDRTLVRFRDTDGNPIAGKVVTIVVDTTVDQIEDIIVEVAP